MDGWIDFAQVQSVSYEWKWLAAAFTKGAYKNHTTDYETRNHIVEALFGWKSARKLIEYILMKLHFYQNKSVKISKTKYLLCYHWAYISVALT